MSSQALPTTVKCSDPVLQKLQADISSEYRHETALVGVVVPYDRLQQCNTGFRCQVFVQLHRDTRRSPTMQARLELFCYIGVFLVLRPAGTYGRLADGFILCAVFLLPNARYYLADLGRLLLVFYHKVHGVWYEKYLGWVGGNIEEAETQSVVRLGKSSGGKLLDGPS